MKEKKDTEKRRLTRQVYSTTKSLTTQVHRLKQINEDQQQEMLRMVEAHDRLQRAAAEMNTLRFSTTRNLLNNSDIDVLSQQLSQIPADLSCGQSPIISSPVSHRSKRSRVSDTPLTRGLQRVPLTALKNRVNIVPIAREQAEQDVRCSVSMTQDEEDEVRQSPVKRAIGSEYGDLIPDEEGFSQFDI